MNGWGAHREVEKPKPIKQRAADCATELINMREAVDMVLSPNGKLRDALSRAIVVLMIVAGEKKP